MQIANAEFRYRQRDRNGTQLNQETRSGDDDEV
ncbi:hypothetical protein MPLA_670054 [Mesorhizobium sp. ORS 3359]|nr:hypothetical protein MPLA_670054 [Mesorhizobium sp. ORS 3359]